MTSPDLNLLFALDVLLTEGSVARAASRLRLSPSAMSRTLARLREATGDPLLVRAGRGLVATPRAEELRRQVGRVVQDAEALLRPATLLDLRSLDRVFTLRTNESFVEEFAPRLVARIQADAPGVRLRFAPKSDKDVMSLRDAAIDLDIGVAGETGPEVRIQALLRDRFIGAVRTGHPLSGGAVTPERYAAGRHISVSRRGREKGPIDEALSGLGLQRTVVCMVSGFSAALAMARTSDLIASVPERHTEGARARMHSFPLPVVTAEVTISMLWHPRLDADPAQCWLRDCVREVCAARRPEINVPSPPRAP
ncbi:LysR family transcriptional regulator [Mesorhizobium sp. Root695]|uniref:LysR family transcriptional regulator n=1 Tax=Mesorhizobium sp. Root695 TaxID=1736589 RepID=UPI00070E0909|nr:LysR family transcriptional regulator [Mesorhizobium sp. Root695]KRB25509.1 LysR family transcriptional regulator [Mesorhizobium sp. Root695]